MPAALQAICIRRTELREHDLIAGFLTREAGKLSAVARGVRRGAAKLAPVCQLAARSEIYLAVGRGLATLAQATLADSHHGLRADVWKSARAAYLCELCDRALPETEPHEALYELLAEALTGLVAAEDGAGWQHSFELRLLAELGYAPVLDRCARGGDALAAEALFCPAAGGLIQPDRRERGEAATPVSPRAVRALRRLLDPAAYDLDLTTLAMPPDLERELREALDGYLSHHLEVELKSAGFMDSLRAVEGSGE